MQALACVRELSIDLERMNIDGGAIAIGHPLGATGARITGKAAQILRSARTSATRSPPSASAAVRASPPCSRPPDGDPEGRRHRGGSDGRRHRRPHRQRRPRRCAARYRAGRRERPERARRGLGGTHAQDRPRALHGEVGRQARRHRQRRGPPEPARRCRLDRRGGDRDGRGQAGHLPQDRFGAEGGIDRLVQHLDHSLQRAARRPAGGIRAGLPHHPLLQPAALHAAAGGGGRARDAGGLRWPRFATSPTASSARALCPATTRRASSPTASAPTGCSGRRARGGRERGDGGGGGRRDESPHRRPEDRRLRPDGPGRSRPDAAGGPQP